MALPYPPPLTPIERVLAPSADLGHTPPKKINPLPYVYLKLVRLRPIVGVGVNFRMRLSDGVEFVHAYFVSTKFDEFVHNGTIKVGQVIEVRRYVLGVHPSGGTSFVGLVWIYPIPCAVVNARSTVSNGPSAAVNGSTVANGSNGVNSSNIAINGPNTAVNGPRAIVNGGPTVVNGPTTVKDPSTIANGLSTVVNDDSIAVKNSSTAASGPNNVISIAVPALQWPPITVPNIWLISSAKLTEDMINIKRTMLNNLASKNMRNANFLVIVLERRKRPDSKSIPKQDWYLWDQSSNDRKTIISVWGELCTEFQPEPGTIVALWDVQINTRYEDNPNSARLTRLTKGGLGHLNAYKNKRPKGLMDPEDVMGYHELKEAWQALQRGRITWEG
ncbi:uncharacterized protein H6S33_000586 [Morchella sextelata]|uniref:uncharacterized protein n=1 Tax=Morchella sextelata TaxID=1174677 RepID=UPI001D04A92A|nr:uncharacterized protein H6S33_000586 [Morchella sextelata]KAH0614950.1 hypothetical protein H6S33_000586 [Morchella sextelata]